MSKKNETSRKYLRQIEGVLFLGKIIILIFTLFTLTSCSFEKIDEIYLFEMESFSVVKEESLIILDEQTEINHLRNAIDSAKKKQGIADMADPEYKIEIGKNTYYLWISEDSGTIMNLENTYTIYSLTKYSAKRVDKIIRNRSK